jgi:hypothetical protein
MSHVASNSQQGSGFERLLPETARLTANGTEAEFCKILELIPGENCFLVRAGVGWAPGVVGNAKVGADLETSAGFALRTGQPVISNHLENEQRFRTPKLLVRQGFTAHATLRRRLLKSRDALDGRDRRRASHQRGEPPQIHCDRCQRGGFGAGRAAQKSGLSAIGM